MHKNATILQDFLVHPNDNSVAKHVIDLSTAFFIAEETFQIMRVYFAPYIVRLTTSDTAQHW